MQVRTINISSKSTRWARGLLDWLGANLALGTLSAAGLGLGRITCLRMYSGLRPDALAFCWFGPDTSSSAAYTCFYIIAPPLCQFTKFSKRLPSVVSRSVVFQLASIMAAF
jgi:hypothetical protein